MCLVREEEAIKLDGLNVAQMKELRDKAEKHTFQAEVDRMMKLIINSLYKNKEVHTLHIQHIQWSGLNISHFHFQYGYPALFMLLYPPQRS